MTPQQLERHKALLARVRALELCVSILAAQAKDAALASLLLQQAAGSVRNQGEYMDDASDAASIAKTVADEMDAIRLSAFPPDQD